MTYTYAQIEQFEILQLYDDALLFGFNRISKLDFISALFPGSNQRIAILESLHMTEKEELFAQFFSQAYNKGKAIDQMSFSELDSWLADLEKIVFEAKATLQGASQAKRERELDLKSSEREKLRNSDLGHNASDAINAVNKRKDRMSKRDKLEETYRALNMSEEDIQSLLGQIKVDETKQDSATKVLTGLGDKPIATHTEEKPLSLVDKIINSVVNAPVKEASKPFDASSLFGPKV